jgi:tetratricopeptide (TPR) repeat protein
VLLSGEAGIGKSRLVQVLKDHVATVPHTRLECRSSPYYQNTALYPITDLLQGIMRWKQDDTAEVKLDKLEEALGEYRLAMEETVPLFAALLSLPIPEDRYLPLKLSPQRQRQKTLEAIVAIIVELSEQQPVLFVLEDLHWTDPTTLELLELLIEQTPAAFLNVLVTCRPEFQPSWSHRSYLTGITVSRLSRDQVERIAQQVAGGKELPAAIIQQLVDKTDGVPLYVEEMTKAALESGALKERSERYELIGSMGSLTIPATLQDSLMARLDRLDAAKAVAQYASVIGRQFSYGLLHAVLDLDDATLRRELGRLVEAELIYQRGAPPQAVYTFKHALIQDTAYESLLRRTRQGYHRQIVEVLEESFPDIAETEPEVLAHHYTCAALYQQAVAYWKQAGDKAAARSAHREAVTCFEQALAALDQLPACRETREQAIDLRLILRGSLHPLGAQRQIMHHLSEAETLALALEDQHRLGQVWARMGHYAWSIGDQERFIELSQQALTTAEACQNTDLQIHAHYYLGAAYHVLGNYSQAIHYLQRVVSSLESDPLWQPVGLRTMLSVTSRAYLAWSLAEMGVFAEAIRIGEEGIQIVETSEKPFTGLVAYVGLGLAYLRKGDLDRATEVLEQGLRWCQGADIPFWLPGLQGALGSVHVVAKRVTSALPLLEQSVAQGPAIKVMIFQPLWISSLAEAYLLGGHVDHALVFGERGLALAQRQKERPHEAYALKLLGDIHAHRGGLDIDQALAYYQQALTLAKALGARPLQAHCHRGLGVLYHQTGQTEQARAELSRAIEMYREMEMTFWLPQTEAVMRSPY